MSHRSRAVAHLVVASGVLLLAGAWVVSASDSPERRTVVAGPRYEKGGLHRFLFGAEYRDLWTTPVNLEVLDLATYAGGLKPLGLVGHGQTKGLSLLGADGMRYTFRPVLKDPTGLLPQELRETIARAVIVDQMASQHPAGHVVAPGLLAPAGILHNEPRLVVMPDDPALGEFRAAFADLVGDIEEWGGSPGFGGSMETIDGEEMWKRLGHDPEVRADSRTYLKARLIDLLMGDWDRHRNQWRWAKVPGQARWEPVPEDRDQAFVRFDGAMNALLRPQVPMLVKFSPAFSSLPGTTYDGWDVDKRILADLDEPAWDEVARELQSELTDPVIAAAVARMPPEYFAKDGAALIAGLESRRDGLQEEARKFYRYINKDVDVFCTDQDEHIAARRYENGDLELSVGEGDSGAGTGPRPYFKRRFTATVTREVRLYLGGGSDEVVVTGGRHRGVLFRVVAGAGDRVDDSEGGGTRVSDPGGHALFVRGPGSSLDTRPYAAPAPNKSGEWIPARDWGRRSGPLFLASFGSDYGVLIGGALNTTGFGFRKNPWSDRQSLRLLYSTKLRSLRGTYLGEFRFENSPFRLALFALGSGIEVSSFFGSGNGTTFSGDQNDFKIEQDRFHLEPALVYSAGRNTDVSLGLVAKYNNTEPRTNPVLGTASFYGAGAFTEVGLSARLRYDATGGLALPRRGGFASAGVALYPKLADATSSFGEIHGQARGFVSLGGDRAPTLAVKAGGQRVWGAHPFFESAFIGGKTSFNPLEPAGGSSVRGLPPERYAGDGSLFGNADLYLPVTRAFLFVPGQLGVTAFYDVGRVFLAGDLAKRWHDGYGGGVFFATPGRHNLITLSVARSEGNTAYYLRAGFLF
jgi:hypothetical protein